mmetsp:Transcript_32628/g.91365  ORF Transcript_32628/g.91365 Transcript_32628/m.91365 type:complete len:135 (+) Transcript_32628:96-500(+)|eukprot:CAMPEP_0119122874 /NCGR_PEP_ID=MMETSP1310-20130426/3000_1 /TAXON_ID=464262 /ORGANISM="Genus nov. species nov., Strain RCC2339" /LENGTH=134 /DNA_ID=CAMNT_0007112597 /DNA_START=96 /DNA_END=500 /DNA_ORIENTATION=-
MADDTFAQGGGSTFVTATGAHTAEENLPQVMKTGTLRMKPKWNKFFYVIRGDLRELQYFKKEQANPSSPTDSPKGVIKLTQCTGIKPNSKEKKYPHCFEIEMGKKTVVFSADAPDEAQSWMHHLRRFVVLHENL